MELKKRKVRSESGPKRDGSTQFKKKRTSSKKHSNGRKEQRRKRGPGLPNQLRKEIDLLTQTQHSDSDADSNSDEANDFYEYEEDVAEEESKKNKRFDPVENYEYELPEDYEDEDVASDEGDDDEGEEDDQKHARMLEKITGLPSDAFEDKKKKSDAIISEAYPESEFNPSRDILDGDGRISIEDLLDPLHGKPGYSKLRKRTDELGKKAATIHAPLPKPVQERLERQAAHQHFKKDITKWEPSVKRNREAPTLYFDEDVDLGFSTVGAIAADFEPRTDFEKNIASLVNDSEVVEAHRKDGARLLELNKISVEDVRERREHDAKLRSLLFRHEMKAKRIKKIKSKTYHRLLKKDRLKAISTAVETDPEVAKELAMKQEFKRAEERMRLKHKNKSRWAQRILERGLHVQDDGTRAAISEQLQKHAELTRKINSMNDSSSSDDSGDEDDLDENLDDSDPEGALKLLNKAKEMTLEAVEDDDDLPKSGLLSLPFMVRGMKKRKEAADEEAKLALQDYDLSLKQFEENNDVDSKVPAGQSGRRIFGAVQKQVQVTTKTNTSKTDNFYGSSESEDDIGTKEDGHGKITFSQTDVNFDPDVFREESEICHDSVFKSFEDIAEDPGLKTTYDVAIFASNTWKKMKHSPEVNEHTKCLDGEVVQDPALQGKEADEEEEDDDSGSDSGGQMVDGILSSGPRSSYELPSQEELIRRAFAGDDVEEDFDKDKQDVLNEENPEPEKPVLLPGWGQWTHIQKKKGLPSWMLDEHETAKKKTEEALKKRKDANLNHVIISEKLDKRAEKLHTKTLPYPYTSKEVFEQSIRMPIGPEFNPASAIGALNRPEVVKQSGVIIKPIRYEDVNPHERSEDRKRKGPKKSGKIKGKAARKMIKAH